MDSVATSGVVATMTRKPRDDVAQWRGVCSLTCLGTENIAIYATIKYDDGEVEEAVLAKYVRRLAPLP